MKKEDLKDLINDCIVEYINEKRDTLTETFNKMSFIIESPMRINSYNPDQLTHKNENYSFTKIVKDKLKTPTSKFLTYDVYSYKSGDYTIDLFVEGDFTIAFFMYEIRDNTMFENKVWQDPVNFGICRRILFEYYLEKFNKIVSDGMHSELGEKYWKKLLKDVSSKGYKTYIIDKNYNKTDINDIDTYYGLISKYSDYKLVIEK